MIVWPMSSPQFRQPLPFDIRVSPDRTYAYVISVRALPTISVIYTLTNTVARTIAIETNEQALNCFAFTPYGRKAYVVRCATP